MLRRITFGSVGDEILKDLCWNKVFVKSSKEFFLISHLFEIDITEFQFFNVAFSQDMCFSVFYSDFCQNALGSEQVRKFNVESEELNNIILQEIYYSTVGSDARVTRLAILEVSDYGENVIWVDQRKICIRDGDDGFFVPRDILSVQHAIKIKLDLNLVTIFVYLGNHLLRPHLILGSCVDGVKGSQSLTLCPNDYLRIIIRI